MFQEKDEHLAEKATFVYTGISVKFVIIITAKWHLYYLASSLQKVTFHMIKQQQKEC